MVALLVFIKATMEFLAEKNLLDLAEKVHFSGGNGFKNPARCTYVSLIVCKTYERQIHWSDDKGYRRYILSLRGKWKIKTE